jgi:membrane-associated phospholipid phosphatase
MKNILNKNRYFLIPLLIFLLVSGSLLVIFSKAEIFFFINRNNSPTGDFVFRYATWLGDGVIITLISIVLLFFRYRWAILSMEVYLFSGLIVQVMKRFIFTNALRPYKVFGDTPGLHLVEGVKMYANHSFPSGHTASAFGMFFILSWLVPQRYLKVMFFLLAFLVAYSRMYLSEHFLIDVTVGSVIGVASAILFIWWMQLAKASWLDRSLMDLIKKSDS